MFDILFGLLFGKSLLLTPLPLDIVGDYRIHLAQPISAVSAAAHLEVELSSIVPQDRDIVGAIQNAMKAYPIGSLSAQLIRERPSLKVTLTYDAPTASSSHVFLKLAAPGGVPTDVQFDQLVISTNKKIDMARVYWVNFGK